MKRNVSTDLSAWGRVCLDGLLQDVYRWN